MSKQTACPLMGDKDVKINHVQAARCGMVHAASRLLRRSERLWQRCWPRAFSDWSYPAIAFACGKPVAQGHVLYLRPPVSNDCSLQEQTTPQIFNSKETSLYQNAPQGQQESVWFYSNTQLLVAGNSMRNMAPTSFREGKWVTQRAERKKKKKD